MRTFVNQVKMMCFNYIPIENIIFSVVSNVHITFYKQFRNVICTKIKAYKTCSKSNRIPQIFSSPAYEDRI